MEEVTHPSGLDLRALELDLVLVQNQSASTLEAIPPPLRVVPPHRDAPLRPREHLHWLGIPVDFDDADDVPNLIGERTARKANTSKKKLAQYVFPKTTAELIRDQDSDGEVESWFKRIGGML